MLCIKLIINNINVSGPPCLILMLTKSDQKSFNKRLKGMIRICNGWQLLAIYCNVDRCILNAMLDVARDSSDFKRN